MANYDFELYNDKVKNLVISSIEFEPNYDEFRKAFIDDYEEDLAEQIQYLSDDLLSNLNLAFIYAQKSFDSETEDDADNWIHEFNDLSDSIINQAVENLADEIIDNYKQLKGIED